MKIKLIKLIILAIVSALCIPGLLVVPTHAYDVCSADVPPEVKDANGCTPDSGDKLPTLIQNIVTAVIGFSSLVSVAFVVVGGINYMTSAGDTGKLQKAKNTIIYALIGLAICALSFAIVNFAISKIG